MKKKFYLLIDTETTGAIQYPLAYDVGFIVRDRDGNIYEKRHYLVREIFCDLPRMATAYYSEKFSMYLDRIANGTIKVMPFREIIIEIDRLIISYGIETICAYNLDFDLRAMENTCEHIFETRRWCRHELKCFCILNAACDVLYKKKYIVMCRENQWETEKTKKVKCTAETGYRYITKNTGFNESHMGLDDCLIESEIMTKIFKTHKRFTAAPEKFPMKKVYNRE